MVEFEPRDWDYIFFAVSKKSARAAREREGAEAHSWHEGMVLTQEEIDGCRDAFLAFDKDRSGNIDVWELRQVMTAKYDGTRNQSS